MQANCLAPMTKCAYKKAQQQIKEEAFQDGDFTQKAHQYLSSSDALENDIFMMHTSKYFHGGLGTFSTLIWQNSACCHCVLDVQNYSTSTFSV